MYFIEETNPYKGVVVRQEIESLDGSSTSDAYLQLDGKWTEDRNQAYVFMTEEEAETVSRLYRRCFTYENEMGEIASFLAENKIDVPEDVLEELIWFSKKYNTEKTEWARIERVQKYRFPTN